MGLKKEIKLLREENKYLKETILALTKRIEELETIFKEKQKPIFIKKDIQEEPTLSGQKEGHIGYSRHIPERIDEIKEHAVKKLGMKTLRDDAYLKVKEELTTLDEAIRITTEE